MITSHPQWPKIENQPEDIGTPLVTMMEFNGPQAMALRRVVAEAFSAKTVQAYRPRMRAKADEMLADLAKRGHPGAMSGTTDRSPCG